jgi:hypothetical protein
MGFHRGPKIITDGLVLHLDAANPKSYPGSGTTWSNLSGNDNDGTLVNGPTFDSGNLGNVIFDGVDDRVKIDTTPVQNFPFTIECIASTINDEVFRITSGDFGGSYGFLEIALTTTGVGLKYGDGEGQGSRNRKSFSISSTNIKPNKPNFINVRCLDIDTIQVNVNQVNEGTATFISGTGDSVDFSKDLYLGAGSYNFKHTEGKLYNIKIYNKTLTQEEVLQNYNATKSRFGL